MKNHSTFARLFSMCMVVVLCLSMTGCEIWNMPIGEFSELMQQETDELLTSLGESAEDAIANWKTGEVTLDEDGTAVLVDNKELFIRIDKMSIESIGIGSEAMTNFVLTVINRTSRYYDVSVSNIAINGWMAGGTGCWLEPGEEEIIISQLKYSDYYHTYYDLNDCGVTEITDARFTLTYGPEDCRPKDRTSKDYIVYANGITAETVSRNERRTKKNETVVADNEDFTFVVLDYGKYDASFVTSPSSLGGFYPSEEGAYSYAFNQKKPDPYYFMNAYIENKTDFHLDFSWLTTAVNNLYVDSEMTNMFLQPHSRGYITLHFPTEDLYRYGMLSVDKISGYLHCMTTTPDYSYTSDTAACGEYAFYPTGLTEDTLPEYERIPSEHEVVHADDSHCLLVSIPFYGERNYSYAFFIENRSDYPLFVSQENIIAGSISCESPEPYCIPPHSSRFGSFPSLNEYAPCLGSFDIIVTNDLSGTSSDLYRQVVGTVFSY